MGTRVAGARAAYNRFKNLRPEEDAAYARAHPQRDRPKPEAVNAFDAAIAPADLAIATR